MTKEKKYLSLLQELRALLEGENDPVARMANLCALLHSEMGFWWTGVYRAAGDELVLGPFQGPVACMRIARGRGVCGTAWAERRTVVVPDVEQFPGHIACSSLSRSEIVVPLRLHGEVVGVLDIDSREPDAFDSTDKEYLEKIASLIYSPERDIWFAAGCFWGAQKFFKLVEGVKFTEVGFANGWVEAPSYEQVYTDTTGHAECVHVRYDASVLSLSKLAGLFFRIIDPLAVNRQGEDVGTRYRSGIYYDDVADTAVLQEVMDGVKEKLGMSSLPVELGRIKSFYPADEYHQDYLDKNPGGYCHLGEEYFELARSL